MIKLGLIGEGIARSQSPDLHKRLGHSVDQSVQYDLIDSIGRPEFDFESAVNSLRRNGYHGTNVTFPFKEKAAQLADVIGDGVRRVGTSNTLLFEKGRLRAENTDYTGFISAYRHSFDNRPAGDVLLIGAGGVGRAVASALGELAVTRIHVLERDTERAESLCRDLNAMGIPSETVTAQDAETRLPDWQGVVNCTPIGHVNHPGCPIDTSALRAHHWVFDAVYIPAHTELLLAAEAAGARTLSGVDLFVFQGIDAFRFFSEGLVPASQIDPHVIPLRTHYFDQLVSSRTDL